MFTVFWKHGCPCPGHAILGLCVWLQQQCHCCLADVEVFIQAHCKLPCQDQEELQSCATTFKWKQLCLWWVLRLWALWALWMFLELDMIRQFGRHSLLLPTLRLRSRSEFCKHNPFWSPLEMRWPWGFCFCCCCCCFEFRAMSSFSCEGFLLPSDDFWPDRFPIVWFRAFPFVSFIHSPLFTFTCLGSTLAYIIWKEADKSITAASSHWTRLSKVLR